MDTPQFMHLKNFQFHPYEFPSLDFTVGGGIRVAPTHLVLNLLEGIFDSPFMEYYTIIAAFEVNTMI